MTALLLSAVQEGFGYAALALGIYISFRMLNVPDLTVDGSFGLGMAISIVLTVAGHPILALFVALLGGACAGLVTGILQTKIKIHPVLSGILTMNMLYTVNLFVTGGKSNVSSAVSSSVFTLLNKGTGIPMNYCKIIIPAVIAAVSVIILAMYFKTKRGMAVRATGDNEVMVRSSSINADSRKCAGLAIANAFVALSGAVMGQSMSFFDVGYGSGMVIVGLASVIIGETIIGKRSVTVGLISAVAGSVIYRIFIALALKVELFPSYALKMISAVIVIIALAIPALKAWLKLFKNKKKGSGEKC